MRRESRSRLRPEVSIPIVSMADIAFLLIIFFMLTSTLIRETGVDVDVPKAEEVEPLPETDVAVEVRGHTDAMGDPQANQRLSERRAVAVVDYMVADGVDADGLTSSGLGETLPVQPNDTPAGRAANRRIEFVVLESARP